MRSLAREMATTRDSSGLPTVGDCGRLGSSRQTRSGERLPDDPRVAPVFAAAGELGLPVRYVGVGEQAGDLLPFNAENFADSLFEVE